MDNKIYWVTVNNRRCYPFQTFTEASNKAKEIHEKTGETTIGFETEYPYREPKVNPAYLKAIAPYTK